MMPSSDRTAVVLFNLGGPDSPEAVRPFLFNLFNDPAIIDLPRSLRFLLAWILSARRARIARDIYRHIGGKSPLRELTEAQAAALEEGLRPHGEYKLFVCMRYWHPRAAAVAAAVKAWQPSKIVLLPLYPQFSTTTSGSSFRDWDEAAASVELAAPTARICCYPAENRFIAAHARLILEDYWKASENGEARILFSAHGLPEKIIARGDPYQWQVEKTVEAIVRVLCIENLDYSVCYQSRVGPMKWIGPSTEEEIERAGRDNMPVLVVPVAFVSEHSETLVELDIEYRKLAQSKGVPSYRRVQALGVEPFFMESLAGLVLEAGQREGVCSSTQERICPAECSRCPCISYRF